MARASLDDRRQRRADQDRRHHRQQNRPAEVEKRSQQQNEDADGRHLRRRRPYILDRSERLPILDLAILAILDLGVAPFAMGAKKFHGHLQEANGAGSVRRRSTRGYRARFRAATAGAGLSGRGPIC